MITLPIRLPAAVPVVLLLATACSGGGGATPSPTLAEPSTAASDGASQPSAGPSSGASSDASDPGPNPWARTATEHRGMDGEQITYDCPPGGEEYVVWGTDVYTDDSAVCVAAVHAGVITLADGGEVTIEIRAGEEAYDASERNGIESRSYGPWGGSFVVLDE